MPCKDGVKLRGRYKVKASMDKKEMRDAYGAGMSIINLETQEQKIDNVFRFSISDAGPVNLLRDDDNVNHMTKKLDKERKKCQRH